MKRTPADIIDERFEKLDFYLRQMIPSFAPDDVHAFRVEVKRLRALLRLCSGKNAVDADRPKLSRRFKRLYRLAGEIRNLQLHSMRVRTACREKEEQVPGHYLYFLQQQITNLVTTANRIADKLSLPAERMVARSSVPARLSIHIRHYLRKTAAGIQTLYNAAYPITDTELHTIRKLLKDLQYNQHYLPKDAMDELLPGLAGPGDGITALTDALGKYQDRCISLQLMEKSLMQDTNEQEHPMLVTLATDWSDGKRENKDKLYDLLTASLHPTPATPKS